MNKQLQLTGMMDTMREILLRKILTAYDQGRHAAAVNGRRSENPFHPGEQPDQYDAWKLGHYDLSDHRDIYGARR